MEDMLKEASEIERFREEFGGNMKRAKSERRCFKKFVR